MPELPEVETIVRALRDGGRDGPSIVGRTVRGAELGWERTVAMPDAQGFIAGLIGQRVEGVSRRGKFVVIRLKGASLLFHLRMSGDLIVHPNGVSGEEDPGARYDRLRIRLDDGSVLVFRDARKFGRAWLSADPQSILGGLGPEPLDAALRPEDFYRRLVERNRQVKPLLMDQSFLAGVGNIYSDEALHLAKIHPRRVSSTLNQEEAGRLLAALRSVLEEGIRRNGASIDWVYRGGSFQDMFRVYGREGQPCPVCGTPIVRLRIAERSSYVCPSCQPEPVVPATAKRGP